MIGILLACVLQEPVVEVEVRPAAVSPKFRLRDGEDGFAGESVFSRELDAEGYAPSPGVAARLVWEDFRVEAGFRELRARGDGTLDEDKNWGGRVVPAGTESDTDVLFRHAELGGFGIVPLAEGLRLEAGAFLEYMLVDADLGFGRTRLGGVFPTPRLRLAAEPWPWLEVYASAGGFFVPFRSGDTSVLDPIEYAFGVRGRWGPIFAGLGYELYHVHLEENARRDEEDIVHLRLRGVVFSIGVSF